MTGFMAQEKTICIVHLDVEHEGLERITGRDAPIVFKK